MSNELSNLQVQVLGVLSQYGPLTPADVSYHLLVDRERARSVLRGLERRKLVDAHYTGGRRGRAYTARCEV